MLSGASAHSGRSLHLGHSLSPALVATATFHWGGRPDSCGAQGWGGAMREPRALWEPTAGARPSLGDRGRGRGAETWRRRRQGWRVTEGGREVFWARGYQPAGERGLAHLGTCGFGLAGSRWASRERRGLGGPLWARRSRNLDFILGRGLLTSACWEGLQGLSGPPLSQALRHTPPQVEAPGRAPWPKPALTRLPAPTPGLHTRSRG